MEKPNPSSYLSYTKSDMLQKKTKHASVPRKHSMHNFFHQLTSEHADLIQDE